VSFGGLTQTAQSKPSGDDVSTSLRFGVTLDRAGIVVEPSVGLDWLRLNRGGFAETGAPAVGLRVASQNVDVVQPSIGVRVATIFATSAATFAPEARLRYLHDVGDGVVPVMASLAGSPSFTTISTSPGRDSVAAGLGAAAQTKGGIRLFVDYDATVAAHATSHAVSGGMRLTF
jgi:outer membrane autotransporter protein